MTQHDPLHLHDAQQAAEDAAPPPIQLADLSEVEREALTVMRLTPRITALFAVHPFTSPELEANSESVQASLIAKGVIERVPRLELFVRLTSEGARLQAELFQQGGAE